MGGLGLGPELLRPAVAGGAGRSEVAVSKETPMSNPPTPELLALAERCEKASGPDREIDAQVARYAPHLVAFLRGVPEEPQCGCRPYTASIDAAMTLVPEGWLWTVKAWRLNEQKHDHKPPFYAQCSPDSWFLTDTIYAATPALALTAASLRALAQMEEGRGR